MVMTQACASPQSTAPLSSSQGNDLAFGAAGALLKYIAGECGVALLSKSLDVRSALSPFHTHIDASSIEALELVQPAAVDGLRRSAGTSLFK